MSSRLVQALRNVLIVSGAGAADSGLFILQLLAWRKITTSRGPDGVPTIEQALASSDTGNALRTALRELSRAESLGANAAAFELNEQLLRSLSSTSISGVLNILSTTYEPFVNYQEAIDSCADLPNIADTYGAIPNELAELTMRIAEVSDSDSVYCPFDGSYKLAVWASRTTANIFVEPQFRSPLPFLLNLLLDSSLHINFSDPITQPTWIENGQLQQFDVTLANPPFGIRYAPSDIVDPYWRFPEQALYGEVLQLRHILAQTKRRAIAFVTNGILFRSAAGERAFKQDIVNNKILSAVIALPPGMFGPTAVQASMVVLEKNRTNSDITFIDASSQDFVESKKGRISKASPRHTIVNIEKIVDLFEHPRRDTHSYIATIDECTDNELNLLPSRYVVTEDNARLDSILKRHKAVVLGDIADVKRVQGISSDSDENTTEIGEVGAVDIRADGSILTPSKVINTSRSVVQKLRKQELLLRDGDIVLAVKGSVGKVGMITGEPLQPMVPGQSYVLIRPNSSHAKIHSVTLYRYLASKLGQALIKGRASGVSVQMIQARDLRQLPVILPTPAEEMEILNSHNRIHELLENIEVEKREIEKLQNKHWDV